MRKNELEFEQIRLSAHKINVIGSVLRHSLTAAMVVGSLWVIMDGLQGIVALQGPDGISAVATIIEAFDLGSVAGYIWGGAATVAWRLERSGKKRIVTEKSRLQRVVESADAYRSSSGLTERGETPYAEG